MKESELLSCSVVVILSSRQAEHLGNCSTSRRDLDIPCESLILPGSLHHLIGHEGDFGGKLPARSNPTSWPNAQFHPFNFKESDRANFLITHFSYVRYLARNRTREGDGITGTFRAVEIPSSPGLMCLGLSCKLG